MFTESKVIELFCMADDFCKFFVTMKAKYTLKSHHNCGYHRTANMSKSEIRLIISALLAVPFTNTQKQENLYQ